MLATSGSTVFEETQWVEFCSLEKNIQGRPRIISLLDQAILRWFISCRKVSIFFWTTGIKR